MKNFDIYFNRLLDFSRMCSVTVYVDNPKALRDNESFVDLGEFDPGQRAISLNTKVSKKAQIAAFLHELGHFYDHMKDPKFSFSKKLVRAYTNYNNEKPITSQEKKQIIECERRAWNHGMAIAKMLKIPLGKWYNQERKHGMTFYRSIPVIDN